MKIYNQSNPFDTGNVKIVDFLNSMKEIIHQDKLVRLSGDIIQIYKPNDTSYQIGTLIDSQDIHQSLNIFISSTTEIHPANENLLHKRATVVGIPKVYKDTIQLEARDIIVTGLDTYAQWEKDSQRFFRNAKESARKANEMFTKLKRKSDNIKIAVITLEGHGKKDFKKYLKTFSKVPHTVNYYDKNELTAENIVRILDNIKRKKSYDCICIVRGGGGVEDLMEFNRPELVNAIYDCENDIPIITGIGHSADDLLCDRAAWFNAGTPTGAANKLNQIMGSKQKELEQCDIKNMKEEIASLKGQITDLEKKRETLEIELAKLIMRQRYGFNCLK